MTSHKIIFLSHSTTQPISEFISMNCIDTQPLDKAKKEEGSRKIASLAIHYMRSVELELKIFSITLEIYYLHQIVMWNDV